MRLFWKSFLVMLLIVIVPYATHAKNEEFRATWVITWEHSSAGYSPEQGKARIRQILDNHVRANMNAVLWQVRQSGTAYYNSSYEPWGYYIGGKTPGYDPLRYVVQEAHKRGIEVHAWFNAFATASSADGSPAVEHPEWVCRDGSGASMTQAGVPAALSPGMEAVREYTLQVAMELVRNYDIDGLHLDYIRWNEYTNSSSTQREELAKKSAQPYPFDGMITPSALEELMNTAQVDRFLYDVNHPYSDGVPEEFGSWEEWWRWSVTTFVESLHDSIQSVKPWVRLSAAALGNYNWGGWNGYHTVFQDAALWFNQGYIDQLTPMHYHWESGGEFYDMLTGTDQESWERFIQPGIEAGRLFTVGPGSYKLAQNNFSKWNRHSGIVNRSRDVEWTDGFQFFSYGSWEDYNYWEEAGSTIFAQKAKIRGTGLIVDSLPPAPGISIDKTDDLRYRLTVQPAEPLHSDRWFALYRTGNGEIAPDTNRIIGLVFGDSTFTVRETFSGLQDFNGKYAYYATALDRYWNESPVSNTVLTDSIPSFAPQVVHTEPSPGDTIPPGNTIEVEFSKNMNTEDVTDAISLTPTLPIEQIIWPEENRILRFTLEEKMLPQTRYQVVFSDALQDINGKPLDGDEDGLAGGDYVLEFFTEARDTLGPEVTSTYPPQDSVDPAVDTDDILSFRFNEKVDPSSMNSDDIEILRETQAVEFGYNFTEVGGKSVLSIQPITPFQSAQPYSLLLYGGLKDSVGNSFTGEHKINFVTDTGRYEEILDIDPTLSPSVWWDPENSGSTTGTIGPATLFETSVDAYQPRAAARERSSAALQYAWDTEAQEHLARVYLSGGDPRNTFVDTSYTLQVYLFGDGSGTLFRFAVDDGAQGGASLHEVSQWIPVDWYGWRLLEWDLGDHNEFGEWLGNQRFDHPGKIRYDSFQFAFQPGISAVRGRIFLDDLRAIKRTVRPLATEEGLMIPSEVALHQNHPNPFNPATRIVFDIPEAGVVSLDIFDIRGGFVTSVVNGRREAGRHSVTVSGENLSAGVYFAVLRYADKHKVRKMTLIK